MRQETTKIAVLASGSGSTVEAFIRASKSNKLLNAEVKLVICNNPANQAGVYGRVESLNRELDLDIKLKHVSSLTHPEGKNGRGMTDEESEAILSLIRDYNCALAVLMGYMKIVRGKLLHELGYREDYESIYQARLINTHPGPIPEAADTFGLQASQQVLDLGLSESKHTVHLVAEGVDTGPVIAEHSVPIYPDDTSESLFARVQAIEKATLPYVIDLFIKNRASS